MKILIKPVDLKSVRFGSCIDVFKAYSGDGVRGITYFLPMYEGKVVNPNTHEWAGFDACKECSSRAILAIGGQDG